MCRSFCGAGGWRWEQIVCLEVPVVASGASLAPGVTLRDVCTYPMDSCCLKNCRSIVQRPLTSHVAVAVVPSSPLRAVGGLCDTSSLASPFSIAVQGRLCLCCCGAACDASLGGGWQGWGWAVGQVPQQLLRGAPVLVVPAGALGLQE